jgi:ABC-type Fe3+/spermidine/putrescine transport system ATPase subunit
MIKYGDRNPNQLSGGQQQRVALARALVIEPDVVLLDEPLSNLDVRLRENMQTEIRSIQQQLDLTVIHVTHDQSEAMAMSDRIVVMNRGKPLQAGPPEEIYEKPDTEFVADFVGTNNLIKAKDRLEILAVRPEDVLLDARGEAGAYSGSGRIVNRIYRGAHIIYEIDTGEMVVRAQVHPGASYNHGDRVYYRFNRVVRVGARG